MLRGAVAARYAEALFDIAVEKNVVDKIESELSAVEATIKESFDLQMILYHPQITADDKKKLLGQLFKGQISDITANFLALLVDRRRFVFYFDIVAEFKKLANRSRNIVSASVTSAVELNDEERGRIDQILARLTGKKVDVSYRVDPSLIGGVVLRIGDKVVDGSVKTRLATLKERLKAIS